MSNQMPEKPDRPPTPQMPNRYRSMLLWVVVLGLLIVVLSVLSKEQNVRSVSTSEFWSYVQTGNLKGDLQIREDRIEGTIKEEAAKQAAAATPAPAPAPTSASAVDSAVDGRKEH